jgi:hypothetical protein
MQPTSTACGSGQFHWSKTGSEYDEFAGHRKVTDAKKIVPLNTAYGAKLDTQTALPSLPNTTFNGLLYASSSDGNGGWYVSGNFTSINGVARSNIAHITATGSLDRGWNPSPDSTVLALARSGSVLYIGGQFGAVAGKTRNNLAAVSYTGGILPWNPNANNYVNTIAQSGGIIYVGGNYTTLSPILRGFLNE